MLRTGNPFSLHRLLDLPVFLLIEIFEMPGELKNGHFYFIQIFFTKIRIKQMVAYVKFFEIDRRSSGDIHHIYDSYT